jgi:hypothetical protein
MLVRLAGIEPTTPWFVAKYSIQLSYSRVKRKYITGSIRRENFSAKAHSGQDPAATVPCDESRVEQDCVRPARRCSDVATAILFNPSICDLARRSALLPKCHPAWALTIRNDCFWSVLTLGKRSSSENCGERKRFTPSNA